MAGVVLQVQQGAAIPQPHSLLRAAAVVVELDGQLIVGAQLQLVQSARLPGSGHAPRASRGVLGGLGVLAEGPDPGGLREPS